MSDGVPIPRRVYEGTIAKIAQLERDLLDARRERDEARKALDWLWLVSGLEDSEVADWVLGPVLAARAAEGGEDE